MTLWLDDMQVVPRRLTDLWKVDGERLVVLSDAHFNLRIYTLNQLGETVWRLINGKRTLNDIIAKVATQYPDEPETKLRDDICSFVCTLKERHLIEMPNRRRAEVLLIVPPLSRYFANDAGQVAENSAPPLGLLYIAAILRDAGISVAVRDMSAEGLKVFDCAQLLAETEPKIVALSILTNVVPEAREILRQVKALSPTTITVAGGIHSSALPVEMLQDPNLDYVLRGEGEETMLRLSRSILDGNEPSDIPGLCCRKDHHVVVTDEAHCITDIDGLPFPARELVDMSLYLQKGALLSSRGCPYTCYFCSSVGMNMHHYRRRKVKKVVEEMDLMTETIGVKDFEFQDDNFMGDIEGCKSLCQLLETRGYRWGCQGTLRQVAANTSILGNLARAGCRHIFFGIETGNDQLLKRLKGVTVEDVKKVVTLAVSSGIHVATGFIVGHPEDTPQTVSDSLKLALWLRELNVHTPVGILNCFPGSPLHQNPEKYNVTILNRNYCDYVFPKVNIRTSYFSAETLRSAYVDFVEKIATTYESSQRISKLAKSSL